MLTYTTMEGRGYDLSGLKAEGRAYFEECRQAYLAGKDSSSFHNVRVFSAQNPLLRATDGWITLSSHQHPLLWALRGLARRLGVARDD